MKRFLFAALALIAPLPAAAQAAPDLAVVEVKQGPKGCIYRTEGQRLTAERLAHRARTWAVQRRRVEVHGNRNTPYRCVGEAMFIMQDAGIEKIAFIGRPIGRSVELYVVAKGCTVMRNGEAIAMAAFRTEAAEWGRKNIVVTFEPDPGASQECVDSVLMVIKQSPGIRLAFVGNEKAGGE